jgi:hypothetical protein
MRRRLHSFLGTILFHMAILSNFYFLMGVDCGNVYVEQSVFSWPVGTPVLLIFLYCGAQFSYEIRNWEVRRQLIAAEKSK